MSDGVGRAARGAAADLTVERAERTTVKLPFRETPGQHLNRTGLSIWRYQHVVAVELGSGHVGHGEAMRYYWTGGVSLDDLERIEGTNAATHLWDDDLGIGVQTALFDAVGRALGVPVHELLGEQVRDRVPLSWWCTKMPPGDWVDEAERAVDAGYDHVKLKGRPWFDIREQIDRLSAALPEWVHLNVDFNESLQDADRAPDVLRDIVDYPQLTVVESPIDRDDVAGARALRDEFGHAVDFARHGGRPTVRANFCEPIADGLIATGHPQSAMRIGNTSTSFEMPTTFQEVGSHLTAAFAVHLAAVHECADWPLVTCHQIYDASLLADDLPVSGGTTPVPEGPGLGVRVDPGAVDRYAVPEPDERPDPPRLMEIAWPDGRRMYLDAGESIRVAWDDAVPYFEEGVTSRLVPEDEDGWADRYERAQDGPFMEE